MLKTGEKDQQYEFEGIFKSSLSDIDPVISNVIINELNRQRNQIELIASENIVSRAVLSAMSSVLTNKYAEGYPGHRYYGGCQFVDDAETIAIERMREIFNCKFANVQPHSGSQANLGVYQALLKPTDTLMGMSLDSGGHLTHGATPNQSGKWFNAVQYNVCEDNGEIDYAAALDLAKEMKPKLIIAGGSAYPRIINFERFREIADDVGAYLMVDMAHFAGLVAGGVHPNPIPYADVVTFTTHKTLRGPRGGAIATNREDIAQKVNSAIFPGIQGGPLMHTIAAKAVAFGEALQPSFKLYASRVVENAKILAKTLSDGGLKIVSGGTDTHIVLIDLRPWSLTGRDAEAALELLGLTCNKNSVPFDTERPSVTSGVRLGTSAATTRGFGPSEFKLVGKLILQILRCLSELPDQLDATASKMRSCVEELCERFPVYPDM